MQANNSYRFLNIRKPAHVSQAFRHMLHAQLSSCDISDVCRPGGLRSRHKVVFENEACIQHFGLPRSQHDHDKHMTTFPKDFQFQRRHWLAGVATACPALSVSSSKHCCIILSALTVCAEQGSEPSASRFASLDVSSVLWNFRALACMHGQAGKQGITLNMHLNIRKPLQLARYIGSYSCVKQVSCLHFIWHVQF